MTIQIRLGNCEDPALWPQESIHSIIGDPPFKPSCQAYKQIRESTEHQLSPILTPQAEGWDDMMRSVFLQYNLNAHDPSGYIMLKLDDYSARELYMKGSRYSSGEEMIRFSYSIIWNKGRIGLGHKFRKKHEVIDIYLPTNAKKTYWWQKSKTSPSTWHGSSQHIAFESILEIPNYNQGTLGVKTTDHINQTPFQLWIPFIRHCVPEGGLVVDPWMGSGSVGLAVQYINKHYNQNLSYWGIEVDKTHFLTAKRKLFPETILSNMIK